MDATSAVKSSKLNVYGIAIPVGDGHPFVEVRGFDIRRARTDGSERLQQWLRRLVARHGVLIFRNQHGVTPSDEVAMNKAFGYHSKKTTPRFGWDEPGAAHDATLKPEAPEVQCQGNVTLGPSTHMSFRGERCPDVDASSGHAAAFGDASVTLRLVLGLNTEGFHSDGLHDSQHSTPVLTSMYCHQPSTRGGETLFACSRAPLLPTAITPERLELLRRLRVHYQSQQALEDRGIPYMEVQGGGGIVRTHRENDDKIIKSLGLNDCDLDAVDGQSAGGPVHPLIRRHPETGDLSVYCSFANIHYMEAPATASLPAVFLDTRASFDLLRDLVSECTSKEKRYAHMWKKGTLRYCALHAQRERERESERERERERLNPIGCYLIQLESI